MATNPTNNKLRNPGWFSFATLAGTLLVAVSSWGIEHSMHGHGEAWTQMLDPQHVFSLLAVIGSVLVAWLSKSPVKG